jgi:hypothetical protein
MNLSLCLFIGFILANSASSSEIKFSDLCSSDVSKNDCENYHNIGLNFTVCQWRHMFPVIADLSLSERNEIYKISRVHCKYWKKSDSELIPDIEGNYCSAIKEPSVLCAKYKLAILLWQKEALNILLPNNSNILLYESMRIALEIHDLQKNYAEILDSNIRFPARISNNNWQTNLIIDFIVFGFLILGKAPPTASP